MAKTRQLPALDITKSLLIVCFIIIIALIALSGFLYFKNSKKPAQEAELAAIMKIISSVIDLPNEIPTFATVSDKSKLPKDPFYSKAQNGDKVLIFTQARKAILYRPSTKKIIEIVPVNIPPQTPSGVITPSKTTPPVTPNTSITPTSSPSATINVVLLNGTEKAGATTPIETTLTNAYNDIAIIDKARAQKSNYEKTLVVDLTGKYTAQAQKMGNLLSASMTSTTSETASAGADILIIVGQDKL